MRSGDRSAAELAGPQDRVDAAQLAEIPPGEAVDVAHDRSAAVDVVECSDDHRIRSRNRRDREGLQGRPTGSPDPRLGYGESRVRELAGHACGLPAVVD